MAEVRIIKTSDCEPGMILASDIVNDYGAVILYQNSRLDEYYINKLINLGLSFIKVYKDYEYKEKKQVIIEAQYNNNLEEFKQVVRDIGNGKTLEMDRVTEVSRSLSSNFDTINDLVLCLSKVRSINEYTYSHSLNVSLLCSLLGSWLNLNHNHIEELSHCGILHDIGKASIPQHILNKPGPLTEEEFNEMKKHPSIGYSLIEENDAISKDVALGVLMHHEREDGSGYPIGLKSKQIHYYAKVLAVVDIFDAMTSNRVYKKRQPPFDVLEMYESEYLTKCDTGIMLTFLKHISSYYIGAMVKLNDGSKGEVVYINSNSISRPLIKSNNEIIDLSMIPELKIVEML
ncbi:MAG TPA: HD-GYP domain-containing protein [Bacillota bacterium]|nr:HD-GYP domain-containing protein [Bacillota bacterium]HOR85702.1 HD-GYP domain-containing protein [Bacillota bacterium]HPL54316.1 HD-GYP domain-containing protein [Bacillota bacterium]